MKKRLLSLLLALCMMVLGIMVLTACDDEQEPIDPKKLEAPVITLTDNVAAWEANSNADKFEISLDGNLSYVENTVTSKTLTDGQILKVRAVGDGSTYSTSDWSNSVTYTASTLAPQPTKLGTPTVTISSTGLANWSAVANASSCVYKINGGEEVTVALDGTLSVYLNNGDVFRVKCVPTTYAIANGYIDSAWVEYTCTDSRTALSTPTNVRIDDSGCLVWDAVDGANYYIIKITYEGDTYETRYGKTSYSGASEMPGAIYRVKAMPKDTETQRASNWSESVTSE